MDSANVSVIIPHFNALNTVEKSIRSVISQSVGVREIIVVDDCSNDYSALLNIVESVGALFPIQIARLDANSGASAARNHGVQIATGKYLAFLDSDDVWHPEKIAIQYTLMESYNLHLSGHLYVPDLSCRSMASAHPLVTKRILPIHFALGNPFFTPTVMVKREGFVSFDGRYRRVDDYKCWLMNIKKNEGVLLLLPLAGGFKPAIGFSGLTSSLKVMHESYITVLDDLYREDHVGLPFFLFARMIEQIKYPLRVLLK